MAGTGDPPLSRTLYAIGIAHYDAPEFAETEDADEVAKRITESVSAVSGALGSLQYKVQSPPDSDAYLDLNAQGVANVLKQASAAGDIVVIYYTGHGISVPKVGYYLCTKDFLFSDSETGLKARDLPETVARKDGRIISDDQPTTLLILDCCFAGKAGDEIWKDMFTTAAPVHPKLWVLATAGPKEAKAGAFATVFAQVLRKPTVGDTQKWIYLEPLIDQIGSALQESYGQVLVAYYPRFSRAPQFFPNPKFVEGPRGRTVAEVTHWSEKAAGGAVVGWYLTGRTGRLKAAEKLAEWIANPEGGQLAVVTGGPGTGKSTVLALPVLLSNPVGRESLLHGTGEIALAHVAAAWLPIDTAIVAVHARGLNIDKVAEQVAAGLGLTAPTATGLLKALDGHPPHRAAVILVDALDESTEPLTLRNDLLVPLARQYRLRLVIGSRHEAIRTIGATDLTIDLDAQTYRDREAVVDYVAQLLVAAHEPDLRPSTPYRDDYGQPHPDTAVVAEAIATRACDGVDSFLIAQVMARAVRSRPARIDIHSDDWENQLPTEFPDAFEEEISQLGKRAPIALILLEALAWAKGPGLPWETIWVPAARAVRDLHPEPEYRRQITDNDVNWLLSRDGELNPASAYIIEDHGPGGRAVFRPFHDRLSEHLRDLFMLATRDHEVDGGRRTEIETALVSALIGTVPLDSEGHRRWVRAHPYLKTYLAEHARDAGAEVLAALVEDPGFLAVADPINLTPLMSSTSPELKEIARTYRRARPLLGDDPAHNAAYLQEAAIALRGSPIVFTDGDINPLYSTQLASVTPDESLLTLPTADGGARVLAFGTTSSGRSLLATAGSGTVRVWDPGTGVMVGAPLTGHTGGVNALAFGTTSEGRSLLATGGYDRTVRLWDAETGTLVGELTGHADQVSAVAFGTTKEGRTLLATGSFDDTVRLWDPDTGGTVGAPLPQLVGLVYALAFGTTTEGRTLLAIASGDTVRLWDPETGATVGEPLAQHNGSVVEAVAFGTTTDGRTLLASGSLDGTVRLWDPDTGSLVGELTGHTSQVIAVAFGTITDGRTLLASGSLDATVRLWDPNTGATVGEPLTEHSGLVTAVAFGTTTAGRTLLATANDHGTVRLWDPEARATAVKPLTEQISSGTAVAFGTTGGRLLLASGSSDGTVRLWDPNTGATVGEPLTEHTERVNALSFGTTTAGRTLLASGSNDGTVRLWDPDTGATVGEPLTGHINGVMAVAFGSTGGRKVLATADLGGTTRLWDPDTGGTVGAPLTGHAEFVHALAFGTTTGGRTLLASGSNDHTVRLWDPGTGVMVGAPLTGHTDGVTAVAFGTATAERTLLASGSYDGTVRLWDPDSGITVGQLLTGHTDGVKAVAFATTTKGRTLLVTAGMWDNTLQLWDPAVADCLTTVLRRTTVESLAANRSQLAIGDEEGVVLIKLSTTTFDR